MFVLWHKLLLSDVTAQVCINFYLNTRLITNVMSCFRIIRKLCLVFLNVMPFTCQMWATFLVWLHIILGPYWCVCVCVCVCVWCTVQNETHQLVNKRLKSYCLLLCSMCFEFHHLQFSCYLAGDKVLLNNPRYDMVRKLYSPQSNLMFFWPCIMNWLYIDYQLDA